MEITYMQMAEEDIPAISVMEKQYFATPWSEAGIRHYLEAGQTIFVVAKDESLAKGNAVVGYAAVLCALDEGNLVSIAVREDYREIGIASELLDFVYDIARDRDVTSINLEVRESNDPAISLYESEGFVYLGKRPGFYSNPKEDALLFEKKL